MIQDKIISKFISVDPEICHGKPCFRVDGKPSRIMIYLILELLENGASNKEITEAYPTITKDHIRAALHYAAQIAQNQEFIQFDQAR